MTPSQVAHAYFAAVRARDIDAFVALFAEDADYIMPDGRAFKGSAQIREVQAGVFTHGAPFPTPLSMTESASGVAVEVEARLPDGSCRYTANIYKLDDAGKIGRLSVYIKTG